MIISEEAVDTVLEMVKLPEKDTKVRKHVQAAQDQVSKVDRCHYIEEYQKEVSLTEIQKRSLVLT